MRRAYEATGYRKASEQAIPQRLEIDSFISFVRNTETTGESWGTGPYRSEADQSEFIQGIVEKWKVRKWPHFENKIVGENYPRLMRVFASRESVMKASDDELFEALCTLHSFYDRLRFFDGGMPTWKNVATPIRDRRRRCAKPLRALARRAVKLPTCSRPSTTKTSFRPSLESF